MPRTINHVIGTFEIGGAEGNLKNLIKFSGSYANHVIWTFAPINGAQELSSAKNINRIHSPVNSGFFGKTLVFLKLFFAVARDDTDFHFWMYRSILLRYSLVFLQSQRVVFHIRHSLSSISVESFYTRACIRVISILGPWARAMIFNSSASLTQHQQFFKTETAVVRKNIIDFRRLDIASSRGVPTSNGDRVLKIGVLGRFHKMKNHNGFLRACDYLLKIRSDICVVMCGRGLPAALKRSQDWENLEGELKERIQIREQTADVLGFYNDIDLLVVPSSWGEGLSNVMIEALLLGINVVSTNVGDAAFYLKKEWLIEDSSDLALAQKVLQALAMVEDGKWCSSFEISYLQNEFEPLRCVKDLLEV